MPRRPYKPRTYIFPCPACKEWIPIKTMPELEACRKAGACPCCQHNAQWLARVKVAAIEQHMARLVTLGTAAPEAEKARYRVMWRTKAAQLAQARAVLAATGLTVEVV